MKKTLLTVAIIATSFAFGQITLEHSFPQGEIVQSYTNESESIYVSMNRNNNTLKIYNADYSLRKTVTIPVPANYSNIWLGGNYYDGSPYSISKHIFNTDDKYEFMVEATDSSNQLAGKKLLLINEDGQLIKDFNPNAGTVSFYGLYYVFHDATVNMNKLIVENLVNGNDNGDQYDVYSLPTSELTTKEILSQNKLSAFPIPANKILNVINPKNGINKIEIYDTSGKLILNKSFNVSENKISLDVESLAKGMYIYKIGSLSSKFIKN